MGNGGDHGKAFGSLADTPMDRKLEHCVAARWTVRTTAAQNVQFFVMDGDPLIVFLCHVRGPVFDRQECRAVYTNLLLLLWLQRNMCRVTLR